MASARTRFGKAPAVQEPPHSNSSAPNSPARSISMNEDYSTGHDAPPSRVSEVEWESTVFLNGTSMSEMYNDMPQPKTVQVPRGTGQNLLLQWGERDLSSYSGFIIRTGDEVKFNVKSRCHGRKAYNTSLAVTLPRLADPKWDPASPIFRRFKDGKYTEHLTGVYQLVLKQDPSSGDFCLMSFELEYNLDQFLSTLAGKPVKQKPRVLDLRLDGVPVVGGFLHVVGNYMDVDYHLTSWMRTSGHDRVEKVNCVDDRYKIQSEDVGTTFTVMVTPFGADGNDGQPARCISAPIDLGVDETFKVESVVATGECEFTVTIGTESRTLVLTKDKLKIRKKKKTIAKYEYSALANVRPLTRDECGISISLTDGSELTISAQSSLEREKIVKAVLLFCQHLKEEKRKGLSTVMAMASATRDPSILSIALRGGEQPQVGQPITVVVNLSDAESSCICWSRSPEGSMDEYRLISNGHGHTYTPTAEDFGCRLMVEVTPVSGGMTGRSKNVETETMVMLSKNHIEAIKKFHKNEGATFNVMMGDDKLPRVIVLTNKGVKIRDKKTTLFKEAYNVHMEIVFGKDANTFQLFLEADQCHTFTSATTEERDLLCLTLKDFVAKFRLDKHH